jgi:hypothetical protein
VRVKEEEEEEEEEEVEVVVAGALRRGLVASLRKQRATRRRDQRARGHVNRRQST